MKIVKDDQFKIRFTPDEGGVKQLKNSITRGFLCNT